MDMKSTNSTEKKSKLEKLEERIAQLERQKMAIQARESEKKRKARTRRLIQIWSIAIKYLGCDNDIEPDEFERRIKLLADEIEARKMQLKGSSSLAKGYCSARTKNILPSQHPGTHSNTMKKVF